jgi:hypothetical protein
VGSVVFQRSSWWKRRQRRLTTVLSVKKSVGFHMRTLRGPEEGQAKEMQGVLEDGFLVKVMFNSGFEGWVRREREGVSRILQCENQVTKCEQS